MLQQLLQQACCCACGSTALTRWVQQPAGGDPAAASLSSQRWLFKQNQLEASLERKWFSFGPVDGGRSHLLANSGWAHNRSVARDTAPITASSCCCCRAYARGRGARRGQAH